MSATTAAAPLLAGFAAAAAIWVLGRPSARARGPGRTRVGVGALVVTVLSVAVGLLGAGAPGEGAGSLPVVLPVVLPVLLPVVLLILPGLGGWALWRSAARRRAAELTRARVLETCGLLAAELSAGQPGGTALARAADEWQHLAPAAEASALGADVPAALRTLATTRGAADLALVAAAWQVAHHAGGGLAASLRLVVDDLRAARETRRVVVSELASARATARLVAALPLAALAMGGGAGGDPVGFLLHHPLGWLCAASGLVLLLAGLGWVEAIASGVDREG